MIRFIDLRGQGTGCTFAFFNTVTNRFIKIGNVEAWEDFNDFRDSYGIVKPKTENVNRCIKLCPPWTLWIATDEIKLEEAKG